MFRLGMDRVDMNSTRTWRLHAACLLMTGGVLVAGGAVGCRPADEIRTYHVAKETRSPSPRAVVEPTHRMLAAIVPVSDQAWFFKAVGTIEQMDALAAEITDFYRQLAVRDDGRVEWQLPDGWQEEPGSDLRLATITVPAGEETLDLTVSQLGWTGTGPAGLLGNVNRWRRQMQLPPAGPAELGEFTSELSLAGHEATLVDLRGQYSSSGMTPPFAGQALPPGHPPTSAGSGGSPVATDGLKLDPPEGWQPLPASGVRRAVFAVRDGNQHADVTVTDFRSAPQTAMADPLANVNRWLGQLGRPQISADDLETVTEPVEVDGHKGTFVKLETDAKVDRPATMLVAMVEVGGRVWFFKMLGDRELVTAQSDNFRALLDSVRFDATPGTNDGDN